jgi:hypothetical protein
MTEPRTSDELFEIALQHMPDIEPEIVLGTWRWNVVDGLGGSDNLGVAGGGFSRRMLESGKFRRFWGVDAYSDHHDVGQYRQALQTVGLDRNYHLLRMTFAEAHLLFPMVSSTLSMSMAMPIPAKRVGAPFWIGMPR